MKIIYSFDVAQVASDVVLTIGTFDGVHLGHRYLLEQLVRRARDTERTSAVLTFHPHPRALLHPELRPAYLSSPEERAVLLESLGIDLLVILPFTRELAETPAEVFVYQLYERLRMRELWVGAGFALGRGRGGNIASLRALSASLGFTLHVLDPVRNGDEAISSTRIRNLLFKGQVADAAKLLGRPYSLSGTVSPGVQRGRTLGFRTANLNFDTSRATPANGVYAVWAVVDGQRYAAVANMGVRPSFGAGDRLLEVHLLDYDGDLYGKTLVVEFVQRLRPEMRFGDVNALIAQVQHDIAEARAILSAMPEHR